MLRKSQPNRNTPLKPTRLKRKRRRGDKPEVRLDYLQEHSTCAVCDAAWNEFDNWLEVHHLVGGSGRADVRANLITLCRWCHAEYHRGQLLAPGHLLSAKFSSDPDNYDESVILKLLGREALPDRWELKPLPDWVIQARERR